MKQGAHLLISYPHFLEKALKPHLLSKARAQSVLRKSYLEILSDTSHHVKLARCFVVFNRGIWALYSTFFLQVKVCSILSIQWWLVKFHSWISDFSVVDLRQLHQLEFIFFLLLSCIQVIVLLLLHRHYIVQTILAIRLHHLFLLNHHLTILWNICSVLSSKTKSLG